MKLTPLNQASSHINAVGYDADTRTLDIEFHSGKVYHYEGVDPGVHEGFQSCDSPGKYFHSAVAGQYPSKRA